MYHFVNSKKDNKIFHGMKGEDICDFEKQIVYLKENYTNITVNEIKQFFANGKKLPKDGFCLTFDDGFKQHFTNVFPLLVKHNLEGIFFVPTLPLEERRSTALEKQRLLQYGKLYDNYKDFLFDFYDIAKKITKRDFSNMELTSKNIEKAKKYLKDISFYSNEERFYRKLRNDYISKEEFEKIVDIQFKKFYIKDEDFIKEYFMDIDDLKQMHKNGMIIGGHSHTHPFLDKIGKEQMINEIDRSFKFLQDYIYEDIDIFSYPYGAYDEKTIKYLSEKNISFAFDTECKDNILIKKYNIHRVDSKAFTKWKV